MITADQARNIKITKKVEIIADLLNRLNDKIVEAAITTNRMSIVLTEKELIYKEDIITELNLNGFVVHKVDYEYLTRDKQALFSTLEVEW
jgi:hypothetical protein